MNLSFSYSSVFLSWIPLTLFPFSVCVCVCACVCVCTRVCCDINPDWLDVFWLRTKQNSSSFSPLYHKLFVFFQPYLCLSVSLLESTHTYTHTHTHTHTKYALSSCLCLPCEWQWYAVRSAQPVGWSWERWWQEVEKVMKEKKNHIQLLLLSCTVSQSHQSTNYYCTTVWTKTKDSADVASLTSPRKLGFEVYLSRLWHI